MAQRLHGSADKAPPDDLAGLAERAEAMSRTELPAMLRKLGVQGKPHAPRSDAELPAGIEEGLSSLGFTEPLAAVRALHAAIRKDGESAARLGAMVRGYALLGILSEFHWHPAHQAFKARALLYAQRLVAYDPKDPRALWHRAHAEALVGLHRNALADLAAAEEMVRSNPNVKRPDWVDLIEACARCDDQRLDAAAHGGPHAALAALLRLTLLEYPASPNVTLPAARAVLALDPECYRACDAMCRIYQLGNLHQATMFGPQVLDQALPRRLQTMAGLPEGVRAQLEQPVSRSPALAAAMVKAGEPSVDDGEPSWAVMGHLVAETRFVHVFSRLLFMVQFWNVPVDEFWAEAGPSVADHPYRQFLDLLVLPPPQAGRSAAAFADKLDLASVELTQLEMMRLLSRAHARQAPSAFDVAVTHMDDVARDLSTYLRDSGIAMTRINPAPFARTLLEVSPHSAFARATLIESDPEGVKEQLAGWEKEFPDSSSVIGALAKRASKQNQPDEARRLLERYVRLAPEYWAFEMLAKGYKASGDMDRWKATLDRYLNVPDQPGLDQARVSVEIANYFMDQKSWDEALPYAEAAAQTGAGWAMSCAARCAEGKGELEQSELWTRREGERYPNTSWVNWFAFCKRTGHGDVAAARAFAEQYLQSVGDRPDLANPQSVGFFYWLNDEPGKAMAPLRRAYEMEPTPVHAVYPLLVADQLGDATARDEWLKTLLSKHGAEMPKSARVCELLFPPVAAGSSPAPDMKAIDEVLQTIVEPNRGNTEFIVGMHLLNLGKADLARKLLEHTVQAGNSAGWTRILSAAVMRDLDRKEGRSR